MVQGEHSLLSFKCSEIQSWCKSKFEYYVCYCESAGQRSVGRRNEKRDVVKEHQKEKDLNGNENVIENKLSNSGTISSKGTAVSRDRKSVV